MEINNEDTKKPKESLFSSRFMKSLEDFFYKVYCAMFKNRFLASIRDGFIMVVPIFMIGAIALLIQYFPITSIRNFIETSLDGNIFSICNIIYNSTFGIASLHILIAITYNYSKNYVHRKNQLSISACMTALACYVALLGYEVISGSDYLSFNLFNVRNVFSSLVVSILSTKLFFAFLKLFEKKRKAINIASETSFRDIISTIFPMFATIIVFVLVSVIIKYALANVTLDEGLEYKNFNTLVILIFTYPFKHLGRTLFSGILILLFQCLFWFFGIHGSNTFEGVNQLIFIESQNEIFTKTFFDTFVLMGGCGSAICLLLALVIFSKSKNNKPLFRRSFVPMIFNINEIMIFGLPVVLNPVLIIPFIITPIFCLTTSYIATILGLVPVTIEAVMWTTPALASGYIATGSIAGSLLQLFNICCGVFIYAPFVKINDNIQNRIYSDTISTMTKLMQQAEEKQETINFLDVDNSYSRTAFTIVSQLKDDMEHNLVDVFYQPICDNSGKVVSSESLLRWNHTQVKNGKSSYIYPPLLINLAKADGIFNDLTKYIIERVMKDIVYLNNDTISVSINLQASQLVDEDFINWIIEKHEFYNIPYGKLCLELTEESAFIESENLPTIFKRLHDVGINLAIDDFSMGHTSISYLQNNQFNFVKIDGGLVKQMDNERVQNIIKSIVKLGTSLGFKVVAEFVEREDQKNMLHSFGCNLYQGYLFSKAIPIKEYDLFIKKSNK